MLRLASSLFELHTKLLPCRWIRWSSEPPAPPGSRESRRSAAASRFGGAECRVAWTFVEELVTSGGLDWILFGFTCLAFPKKPCFLTCCLLQPSIRSLRGYGPSPKVSSGRWCSKGCRGERCDADGTHLQRPKDTARAETDAETALVRTTKAVSVVVLEGLDRKTWRVPKARFSNHYTTLKS